MIEFEFDPVDSASVGALGEPGQRVFMVQGKKANMSVAVVVEKQQIELLTSQSLEFLNSLNDEFPEEDVPTPTQFDAAGSIDFIEPMFRARSMGLIFDPDTMLVTLELRELPFEDGDEDEFFDAVGQDHEAEHVVRLTMTRTQLRAIVVKGTESIEAGREPCPLCLNPMDITGHLCPRLN